MGILSKLLEAYPNQKHMLLLLQLRSLQLQMESDMKKFTFYDKVFIQSKFLHYKYTRVFIQSKFLLESRFQALFCNLCL